MNKKQYLEFFDKFVEDMKALTRAKNSDYCGTNPSPFSNFERVNQMGICSTEQGFLTRMTDKFCRVNSYVQKGGELSVKSEGVRDTLMDLAVYSILLAAYLESQKVTGAHGKPEYVRIQDAVAP